MIDYEEEGIPGDYDSSFEEFSHRIWVLKTLSIAQINDSLWLMKRVRYGRSFVELSANPYSRSKAYFVTVYNVNEKFTKHIEFYGYTSSVKRFNNEVGDMKRCYRLAGGVE